MAPFLLILPLGLPAAAPASAASRPENLALQGRVSASSSATDFAGKYGPPRAVDGDFSTHWASRDDYDLPQWFQVDFAVPQTVDTIFLHTFVQPGLWSI